MRKPDRATTQPGAQHSLPIIGKSAPRAAPGRQPSDADSDRVPSVVHEVLRSPSEPLEHETRTSMEQRFGHDFSAVRVHTDARAAESARAVEAMAYTVGPHIVFGQGTYQPGTQAGVHLLAHELTHVVQQAGGAPPSTLRLGNPADASEQVAERVARGAGGEVSPMARTAVDDVPTSLQRAPLPDDPSFELRPTTPLAASMHGSLTIDGFGLDSSELTEDHRKRLAAHAKAITDLLTEFPESFISIAGHTDATGKEHHNKELGQQRAELVLAELEAAGVPAEIMRAGSLGETVLRVETKKPEPRNRRVEIFFHARSFFKPRFKLTPPATLGPGTGARTTDLTEPPETAPSPRESDAFKPTKPEKGAEKTPAKGPETPRPGTAGDVVKALMELDPVKKTLHDLAEKGKRDWKRLPPGGKAATVSAAVALGAGALAGIASDPETRKFALDALNGKEFSVPGVKGLKVQVFTSPGGGAVLKFDLTTVIPGLK